YRYHWKEERRRTCRFRPSPLRVHADGPSNSAGSHSRLHYRDRPKESFPPHLGIPGRAASGIGLRCASMSASPILSQKKTTKAPFPKSSVRLAVHDRRRRGAHNSYSTTRQTEKTRQPPRLIQLDREGRCSPF